MKSVNGMNILNYDLGANFCDNELQDYDYSIKISKKKSFDIESVGKISTDDLLNI